MIEENVKLKEFLDNNPVIGGYYRNMMVNRNKERDELTKENFSKRMLNVCRTKRNNRNHLEFRI